MQYRFPLSFVVLTAIVVALRFWIDNDRPRPSADDDLFPVRQSIERDNRFPIRQALGQETVRFAKLTPSGTITVADIAATASALHRPETTADDDLEILGSIIDFYRHANGETLPAGRSNEEIVRQMRGNNGRKLAVFPSKHPSIDSRGQLLDRWGNPYHFQPVSHSAIEIRSAGPDGKLWTEDDITRAKSAETMASASRE